MSAFGGKADIVQTVAECPLLTQSGHDQLWIAAVQTNPEPHFAGLKSLL
jgi:hypothetical protein